MEPSQYLDATAAASTAFVEAARTAGLEAAVPTCPGWSVRDLVNHVGRVHGWVTRMVDTGSTTRADFPPAPEGASDGEFVEWAAQAGRGVVDALRRAEPDGPVWTFGQPRSVRFWLRRMAQETTIHAFDAGRAARTPTPVPADLAADGLDEFGEMILPRVVGEEAWTGQSIHLHRTDGDGEWLWVLGPGKTVTVEHTHAKGDLALRGAAPDLLLWAANRQGTDSLQLFGDESLVTRWSEHVHF